MIRPVIRIVLAVFLLLPLLGCPKGGFRIRSVQLGRNPANRVDTTKQQAQEPEKEETESPEPEKPEETADAPKPKKGEWIPLDEYAPPEPLPPEERAGRKEGFSLGGLGRTWRLAAEYRELDYSTGTPKGWHSMLWRFFQIEHREAIEAINDNEIRVKAFHEYAVKHLAEMKELFPEKTGKEMIPFLEEYADIGKRAASGDGNKRKLRGEFQRWMNRFEKKFAPGTPPLRSAEEIRKSLETEEEPEKTGG